MRLMSFRVAHRVHSKTAIDATVVALSEERFPEGEELRPAIGLISEGSISIDVGSTPTPREKVRSLRSSSLTPAVGGERREPILDWAESPPLREVTLSVTTGTNDPTVCTWSSR